MEVQIGQQPHVVHLEPLVGVLSKERRYRERRRRRGLRALHDRTGVLFGGLGRQERLGVPAHRAGFSLRPRTSSSSDTPFTWITL